MSNAVQELLATLDLETIERDIFRGSTPKGDRTRVFGGQVVAQALVAATRTVEGRAAHSLHAYFLLPGDPALPILYEVDRIRDGRSFTTRRVVAVQKGEAIFSMSVSFHDDEEGFDHAFPMPEVPDPEALPSEQLLREGSLGALPEPVRRYFGRERPIEVRPVDMSRYVRPGQARPPRQHIWIRTAAPLPDDPAVHRTVLAYASDMTLLDTALVAHGRSIFDRDLQLASLDHALWLHRPFRVDDWLLYSQDSPSASGARGFTRGLVHARDGRLVASVAQEGLIRRRRGA